MTHKDSEIKKEYLLRLQSLLKSIEVSDKEQTLSHLAEINKLVLDRMCK
jgi:hypothetical protein